MTGCCANGPASPLADRAGYVPRSAEREQWCTRPCAAGCGDETASERVLCSGCEGDWVRGIGDDDVDLFVVLATVPFGVCGGAR